MIGTLHISIRGFVHEIHCRRESLRNRKYQSYLWKCRPSLFGRLYVGEEPGKSLFAAIDADDRGRKPRQRQGTTLDKWQAQRRELARRTCVSATTRANKLSSTRAIEELKTKAVSNDHSGIGLADIAPRINGAGGVGSLCIRAAYSG